MLRSPRAPVSRSDARSAAASSASWVKTSSTPSRRNICSNWRTSEFLGSVRIRTSAVRSSGSTTVITGRRPTNSGIRPNFIRSSGAIRCSRAVVEASFLAFRAPKPNAPRTSTRSAITFSMPSNVPPQMNRMFIVSIWMNSWCGCLRPPCGGTLASVPSMIFSSACCTPSPLTSRVIEGLSPDLRVVLSISSM